MEHCFFTVMVSMFTPTLFPISLRGKILSGDIFSNEARLEGKLKKSFIDYKEIR